MQTAIEPTRLENWLLCNYSVSPSSPAVGPGDMLINVSAHLFAYNPSDILTASHHIHRTSTLDNRLNALWCDVSPGNKTTVATLTRNYYRRNRIQVWVTKSKTAGIRQDPSQSFDHARSPVPVRLWSAKVSDLVWLDKGAAYRLVHAQRHVNTDDLVTIWPWR